MDDADAFARELEARVGGSRVCIGAEGAESSLPGPKESIRYSVSMGVASSLAEGHPSATQFEALVLEADAELYRVKSARPKESKRKA